MADCCSGRCPVFDRRFDERSARRELAALRSRGPEGLTARLIDELTGGGVDGWTVLEVGGGVGAVHLGLLERGASSAVDVDASGPYIVVAREEAEHRGLADRVRHVQGDFVSAARTDGLEPGDLVALDRVLCCYADVVSLVRASARLARRRYGLVYPVDRWWTRGAVRLINLWARLSRDPFRVFVHPTALVNRLVREQGLEPTLADHGLIWQIAIYERRG